jgi:hypothetical protein
LKEKNLLKFKIKNNKNKLREQFVSLFEQRKYLSNILAWLEPKRKKNVRNKIRSREKC